MHPKSATSRLRKLTDRSLFARCQAPSAVRSVVCLFAITITPGQSERLGVIATNWARGWAGVEKVEVERVASEIWDGLFATE